jgi:hypothetical protein
MVSDQVFRIGYLQDEVMGVLRGANAPMTAGAVTVALGLPLWAVQAGLEAAMAADLVEFSPLGYSMRWIHLVGLKGIQ